MPMDPAVWSDDVHVRKGELLAPSATKEFNGPSDAYVTAAVYHGETGADDDPVIELRLLFRYGMFRLQR
jgi:hypothetical protein